MLLRLAAILVLIFTTGGAPPILAQDGDADGNGAASGSSYEDWGKVCEDVPRREKEVCYIAQTIEFAENDVAIQISVGRLVADHDGLIAVIRVPTGVDLGAGLALRVDETEQIKADYDVCLKRGCRTYIDLEGRGQLNRMRQGKALHIGFVPFGSTETRVVRASLDGFAAGVNSLGE
jgi:invasion protein IalB